MAKLSALVQPLEQGTRGRILLVAKVPNALATVLTGECICGPVYDAA